MRVNRQELVAKLGQVRIGLADKEIIEQTSSFIFQGGKITTFNDEILCQVEYEADFEGAVHAKQLADLLDKLSEPDIEITTKDGEILVRSGNKRAGIRMDADIQLKLDEIKLPEPDDWADLGEDFTDAIEIVQNCASRENSNFNLTCIHLTPNFVEACDNYQLMRYTTTTGLNHRCLVRRDSIKQITGLGMSQVSESEGWVHFRSPDGLQLSCRKWTDEYSSLDEVLTFDGTKITLPGGLGEAVEKAEIFSSDGTDDDQIRVDIKRGNLRLKGQGAHGWYEERRKFDYTGDELSFYIGPKLLVDIINRTNECEVDDSRMKIDAEKFVFVACLGAAN